MKQIFYISCFTFLGVLLQFIAHALIETFVISLLVADFERFGLGWSWEQWYQAHKIFTITFLGGGAAFGFWQGRYWWQKIYVEGWRWKQNGSNINDRRKFI